MPTILTKRGKLYTFTPIGNGDINASPTLDLDSPEDLEFLRNTIAGILGGEDKFVMEYIADEGKLVVHTDRLSDEQLTIVNALLARVLPQNIVVDKYNHNIEISWRDINKYAACVKTADLAAVNPDYKQDVTTDGEWVYQLPLFVGGAKSFEFASKLKKWCVELPKFNGDYGEFNCCSLTEWRTDLPNWDGSSSVFCNNKMTVFDCKLNPNIYSLRYILKGNPDLRVFNCGCTYLPNLNDAEYAFFGTQLNKESVIHIAQIYPQRNTALPTHIGIHVDLKNDPEVLEAIALLESKNWTLTVQWRGTPTSGISTTDLEEIWCKVSESEYGEYTDENGNRCTLDWGHYVTDSSEYKLFYSLVEAEQYFKLNKIEVNENE